MITQQQAGARMPTMRLVIAQPPPDVLQTCRQGVEFASRHGGTGLIRGWWWDWRLTGDFWARNRAGQWFHDFQADAEQRGVVA